MNPATFLRVNGPEPWNVCYPEPSVRPDDSRYGNNPNRVQRHTQFQVIMKPDPGNPQELYLGSLEALGIDTQAHDIRFVEDNWVHIAIAPLPSCCDHGPCKDCASMLINCIQHILFDMMSARSTVNVILCKAMLCSNFASSQPLSSKTSKTTGQSHGLQLERHANCVIRFKC